MVIKKIYVATFVATTLLLSACSQDDSNPSNPNNISAEAVAVVTPDPRIAYPLKVSVTLKADFAASNVSVSLFAIDRTDDPNAEVRQIPLGTVIIENVAAGSGEYELDVSIPSSVEFAGPYYIGAIIDPVDAINELNEDDNEASVEVMLAATDATNIQLTYWKGAATGA